MKKVTSDVPQGEQQQQQTTTMGGRNLSSSCAPPNLENKLLTQTTSCLALQPSSLSSTSSSLLSTSSPSPLLSTENKLLSSHSQSPLFSSSLTSCAAPKDSLLSASTAWSRFAHPSSVLSPVLGGEQKSGDGRDEGGEKISEAMEFSYETSVSMEDEEEGVKEDNAGSSVDLAALVTDFGVQEPDQSVVIRKEEFTELDRRDDQIEEELKDKKYLLLNAVCCSLINKMTNPGEKDWDSDRDAWPRIMDLSKDISVSDPQFILKVAVYTRQELNIRITSNFLLALAAHQPSTKSHLRRYFCAAIQLPSDWLEVVRIYSTCFSRSLPMCLKKAMADKFKQFNEYQLAKYNTRKHRCKHSRNRSKNKKPDDQQLEQWANLLRSDKTILSKFLQVEGSKVVVVDKKQSEFSMKKMIKRLHIKEPAEHVMAILGKKYPADIKSFTKSGMKGEWVRERAGQRMKLKDPETWERLVTLKGNKAATWETLIDNKSLPFMAMLRNLRNMITKGISEAHHEKILHRLTDKKSVIQSRQFPFRFLAAYKVIMELRVLASASQQAIPPAKEILKDIVKKIPKSKRFKRLDWEMTGRSRLRVTRGVPFIYKLYRRKKAQLRKANERMFTVDLLDRYRKALETAVQLSCRYNVPPLPGRTVILMNSCIRDDMKLQKKQDFCLPPDPEEENEEKEEEKEEEEEMEEEEVEDVEEGEEEEEVEEEEVDDVEEGEEEEEEEEEEVEVDEEEEVEEGEDEEEEGGEEMEEEEEVEGEKVEGEEEEMVEEKEEGKKKKKKKDDSFTPSITEISVLLSLMICSSVEDSQLFWYNWSTGGEVKLKSDDLLDNVRTVVRQLKECKDCSDVDTSFLSLMSDNRNKIDNIIVVTDNWINVELEWVIASYRRDIHTKALFVKMALSNIYEKSSPDRNHVNLIGFSEQMVRIVAERGSSRLLDHVEHLDKLYNIPPPKGTKEPRTSNIAAPIPASPKLRWRGIRVFVSSTFRDMHAERDILVRSVFPELRRRAAQHCLYLQEVELRWGVTEEESERAAELCLSEVCRSQMMVGILGERYGLVPLKPDLPDLPQYSWLVKAPAGMSITEMEIRQFQALYPDTAQQRMFCYFRDPNITKSVPVAWRSHFNPESREAESKMASLKKMIRNSEVKVTKSYPCEWGGVVDGKPYLKNLEDFGKAVLEDLWTAVSKHFVDEQDNDEAASGVREQEVYQGALQRQFFGRQKLLSAAVETVEKVQTKGGMMVLEGGPGEGKTVFMAALAETLRTLRVKSKTKFICDVISYSTAASQSARSVENLLQYLIQRLREMKDTEEKKPLPSSYRDLLSEFHSSISDVKKDRPLVLLVDGVDLVSRDWLCFDWIPQQLPQGVCLVVSVPSRAALLQTLTKRGSSVLFSLGQLTMQDRREIVQKGLDTFGKKLSESAFNNQLQTLIMKKGAVSPLYLHLACEDLRNYASFDKLTENLESLPQFLSQLVKHSLDRLCTQHRGMLGLRWALGALTLCVDGLRERDLYSVLNTCNDLSSRDTDATWEEVLHLSRKPKGRVPMATFTQIVQSLRGLIGSSYCHNTDDLLILSTSGKMDFGDFLVPTENDRTRAHLVLAAHLWARADPQGTDTFLHCEADSVMHLPSYLIQSDQKEPLQSLLSNYYFLYAQVRHGLVNQILQTYHSYLNKPNSAVSCGSQSRLEDCHGFLKRHSQLLSSWPALFVQQALNEPPETSAHTWAQGLMGKGGVRVVEWLNNDSTLQQEPNEVVSTFSSELTCAVVSSDKDRMVASTKQGTLHCIKTQTGQEVKSLVSSCDGISSCMFLKDGRLATTSYDGRMEIWDIKNSCRTALIDAHTNTITGSDITADEKNLATVSLDFTLKVWSSAKGNEVAAFHSSSPLNCVTFDPDGHLLAAGCWDGNVIVWNWLQNKTVTNLSGHKRSVRSLSFAPSSSSMLCSGSVSGEVRVWSVPTSTCVGCFQAHSGATETLFFLGEGNMLLTAGSDDHMLHLWSGGLGRSVTKLKTDVCEQEPPRKKHKSVTSVSAALCVAVNGDYAAVGYHGDGIRIFSLESGEKIWDSGGLDVSVPCLRWVYLNPEQSEPELLVSAGSDKRLRVWKKKSKEEGLLGGLDQWGMFSSHFQPVLAMEQNSKYLVTASDDCNVFLWLLSNLAEDPFMEPCGLLKGHTGGVTCLSFSPDGEQLLSGGKDKALMVWDVSVTPPVLSKSLPHSHRDWITGCVWTPDCVISSSNDGRLCFWDLQAGKRLKEISWTSSLTSVCCLGQFVVAGCAEGGLHVWNWETNSEISHIAAHKRRIHACSVLPNTDKEVNPEEMSVLTASDDGTVQLWKPLQMEHFNSFAGPSGSIHGIVHKDGHPDFAIASEGCSLLCWTLTKEGSTSLRGPVTALCFSQTGDLLLVGYESGYLEIWQNNVVVGHKQASASAVTAICSMPDNQFAVSYLEVVVDEWKLVWNEQHSKANLVKVKTYKINSQVIHLMYCTVLLAVSHDGEIFDVANTEGFARWNHSVNSWSHRVRVKHVIQNDEKSMWLVGEDNGKVEIGFIFTMGPEQSLDTNFGHMDMKTGDEEKEEKRQITAVTINKDLIVCGDEKGNMWFMTSQEPSKWQSRKLAHSDRISVLRLTDSTIISASYDRTVKLWDRNTKKQVGMFVCRAAVLLLEVNPVKPTVLVCGDRWGKLYFLSWKE